MVSSNLNADWAFKVGQLYIPIYVIVFGLIGGYLRYLYKTSRLLTDEQLKKEIQGIKEYLSTQDPDAKDVTQKVIFFESLKDVALFFLAPILAIVAWFLFSQWEPTGNSVYLLALISFASGLTTTEIVNTVTDFARKNLTNEKSSHT